MVASADGCETHVSSFGASRSWRVFHSCVERKTACWPRRHRSLRSSPSIRSRSVASPFPVSPMAIGGRIFPARNLPSPSILSSTRELDAVADAVGRPRVTDMRLSLSAVSVYPWRLCRFWTSNATLRCWQLAGSGTTTPCQRCLGIVGERPLLSFNSCLSSTVDLVHTTGCMDRMEPHQVTALPRQWPWCRWTCTQKPQIFWYRLSGIG